MAGPGRLRSDRPLEGRGRGPRRHWIGGDRPADVDGRQAQLSERCGGQEEAVDILRCELYPQRCSESVKAEDVQIFVEVAQPWRQGNRLDACGSCALRKSDLYCVPGRIGVAGDIEAT